MLLFLIWEIADCFDLIVVNFNCPINIYLTFYCEYKLQYLNILEKNGVQWKRIVEHFSVQLESCRVIDM